MNFLGCMWEIIDSGVCRAESNMAVDAELLASLEARHHPILHFYEWEKDSATYGHFVSPADYLDMEKARERGLDLGRRPTGGGISFHLWDMAFSVLVPSTCSFFSKNTLENYAFVNTVVLKVAKTFLEERGDLALIKEDMPSFDKHCERFCMAMPTKYDVVLEGKKIAGAAQRQTKAGYLHQGTIALMMPEQEFLKEVLLPATRVIDAMETFTYPLLGKTASRKDLQAAKLRLKQLLTLFFEEYATEATERKNSD